MDNSPNKIATNLYALWWALLGLGGIATLGFRMVKTSSLSQTFRTEDIPFLNFLDTNYALAFWGLAGLSVIGAMFSVFIFAEATLPKIARRIFALGSITVATLWVLMARSKSGFDHPELYEVGVFDWISVFGFLGLSILGLFLLKEEDPSARPKAPTRARRIPRLSIAYLLTTAILVVNAILEHQEFWYDHLNDRGIVSPTLLEVFADSKAEANLLFFTTSLLFVSMVSGVCVLGALVFRRWVSRPAENTGLGPRQWRFMAIMFATVWTLVTSLPWITKLWPEIAKEQAWLFPISVFAITFSIFLMLTFVATRQLVKDFTPKNGDAMPLRPSDLGFVAYALSPLYLLLSLFMGRRSSASKARQVGLITGVIGLITALGMAVFAAYYADIFDFDDWRDMLKRAQLPTLRIAFSATAVWGGYSILGMIGRWWISAKKNKEKPAASEAEAPLIEASNGGLTTTIGKWSLVVLALALGVVSSFPFWGHSQISENTHARAVEFSDRHAFEIQFLHSLFDFDRDGYSAILHGADPDDFDADVQAFGFPPLEMVSVPTPEVEVYDADKARAMPNVVLLYLEGFTNDSINFFGRRDLTPSRLLLPEDSIRENLVAVDPKLRSPTPFMDDIGLRGTAFEKCRTVYPSTWDGWMQSQTGKHLMISEFNESMLSKNIYSRFNLIDKTVRAAGFNRFCYANSTPYANLFISRDHQFEDFQHDADVSVNEEEEERGLWESDKQVDRIVDFIFSLDPEDRFFISEHMEDGHFPWKKTSDERVRDIGRMVNYHYNGTFDWVTDDARSFSDKEYTHDGFLQEVTRIDAQIGRITNALKRRKLWDNSIVVIMGDHGCQWYEHRHRFYVTYLYDQAINPPFFIKVPGMEPQKIVLDSVQQVDLVPTLMELAGVRLKNPEAYKPDGISLVPYLKGEVTEDYRAKVDKRSMLLKTHYDKNGYIHEGRYKLIADRPFGAVRLFDLHNDPKELHNLADEEPELVKELTEKMAAMAKEKMALLIGISPPE